MNGTLDLSQFVRVWNKSPRKLVGMHHGNEYVFEVNEFTDIHEDAAKHIFGFGDDDKTRAFLRLGWLANGKTMDDALAQLAEFEFGEVPNPSTPIRRVHTGTKTSSPTLSADAGAKDGGASPGAPLSDAEGKVAASDVDLF